MKTNSARASPVLGRLSLLLLVVWVLCSIVLLATLLFPGEDPVEVIVENAGVRRRKCIPPTILPAKGNERIGTR